MASWKRSLKNRALLHNLTHLKPVLWNKTRWSGKLHSLSRFLLIHNELIDVADEERSNIDVDSSIAFKNK
eukprot:6784694-Ditylum_brightwellii.AAC.1